MLDAMKAVEEKRMTIRGAAKKFLVPYSTLKDRVHGRVRHGTKPGVKTALSPEEEEELVRYIKDMEAAGFQMRNADVRERAGELLRLNYGHSSPYGEGCSPGHNWFSGFMKRHQGGMWPTSPRNGVEFKRQISRAVLPSCTRQRLLIRKFYEITGQVYKKNRIQTKPERIYSVSEMKMCIFQKATIIYCASAAGAVIPPFVIFKGQQKLKLMSAREAYPQAFFTSSNTGQVTEEIFLWWFRDHFLKVIPHTGNRPLVLLISQPCVNISLQMYQLAKEERVIFISIPSGVSHLLQPLDDELGSYIENCLSKKVRKWEVENHGVMFTQKILAQLLHRVWKKVLTAEEICHKFSIVGIYPLNPAAISTDKILAKSHAMRESLRRSPSPTSVLQNDDDEEDDPLQGLSLLSALSSHEYASIGRGNTSHSSQDNLSQSFEEATPKKRLLEDFDTPSPPINPKPAKRQRVEVQDEESGLFQRDMSSVIEQVEQKAAIDRPSAGGKLPADVRYPKHDVASTVDVHSEIVLARENLDQINRAVDSILSSEASASQEMSTCKINNAQKNAGITAYKTTSPLHSKPADVCPKTVIPEVKISRSGAQTTKRIIFMLNKDGQLVSRTELTPSVNKSVDVKSDVRFSGPSTLRDALTSNTIFPNIKVEEEDAVSEQNSESIQLVEEQVIEETPEILIPTTTSSSNANIDSGFSIANHVEDQPPQHLLQDEEVDLDTVDTIVINGQLFKVVRAPCDVKQEVTEDVEISQDGIITDITQNYITEDGIPIDINNGASVIHQEVVQDYEVTSFEVPSEGTIHGEQLVIEEQTV